MYCLWDELSEYMYEGRVVEGTSCRGRVVKGPVVRGQIDVVSFYSFNLLMLILRLC